MSVAARFFVQTITRHAASDNVQVRLAASSRGAENKTWAQYTPAGSLELSINNPSAAEWFEQRLGKDIALTFEDRPVVCPECKQETPVHLTTEHQTYVAITCEHCGHTFDPQMFNQG